MGQKTMPIDEDKVISTVIDVYLWISGELNSDEVRLAGQKLIGLADRQASDVEMEYQKYRVIQHHYGIDDIYPDPEG